MSDHPELTRTVELDDLTVRTEGGAREIDAYAAVFDTPAEITDHDGHYWETISRGAFDRTIAQRGDKVSVLCNHGRDTFGQPSDRFALPIGRSVEIKADARGLLTRSKIAKTTLGDEVLELCRAGVLDGFSFRAAAIQTTPHPAGADGLPTLERTEFALREFGPGIFVAYPEAEIMAVRAQHWVQHLTDTERDELRRVLADTPDGSSHEPADPTDPGHSDTPSEDWRSDALRIVARFDLKGQL